MTLAAQTVVRLEELSPFLCIAKPYSSRARVRALSKKPDGVGKRVPSAKRTTVLAGSLTGLEGDAGRPDISGAADLGADSSCGG